VRHVSRPKKQSPCHPRSAILPAALSSSFLRRYRAPKRREGSSTSLEVLVGELNGSGMRTILSDINADRPSSYGPSS
jgi:hypothetical protein